MYKQIEITGSSRKGVQEAIEHAISRASKTIHQIRWFQVTDTRGYVEENKISYWQVTLKIGFSVDDPGA
ncbi:MAG: dodecin domain-containing protein [Syntrophobacterales bacterium]|nr:MAG: dodecin domain-containing protein [Syntrophobacterales bacterium]